MSLTGITQDGTSESQELGAGSDASTATALAGPPSNGRSPSTGPSSVSSGQSFTGPGQLEAGNIPGNTHGIIERMKISIGLRGQDSAKFNKDFQTQVPSLSEYPWGYPLLAALQHVEPEFLMARRFEMLHNRILLWKQDQLRELEFSYLQFERAVKDHDPKRMVSRKYDESQDDKRKQKLEAIDAKLREYDELLFRVKQLNSLPKPSRRDVSSLYKFVSTTGTQQDSERQWIGHVHDLAALGPDVDRDWFRQVVEDCFFAVSHRLTMLLLRSKDQNKQSQGYDDNLRLVSKTRVDIIVYIVLSILSTAMLLIPVGILSWMQNGRGSSTNVISEVLVIFGFTLFFTLCVGVLSRASRNQVFLASATYIAVLVVFLGSVLQTEGQLAIK